jgi:hypothetical protein
VGCGVFGHRPAITTIALNKRKSLSKVVRVPIPEVENSI